MRKRLLFVASLVLALWATPAAADTILFDVDGTAGGTVVTAAQFDWGVGNSMLVEGAGNTATIYYQANLSVIRDASNTIVYTNGVGGDYFTAVATFDVVFTSGTEFEVIPGSGTFNIYADDEAGIDLTGKGFAADPGAVLILSGSAATGGGDLDPDTPPCTFGTPIPDGFGGFFCLTTLDQSPNGNQYPGANTIGGTGGFLITVNVDPTDTNTNYFLQSPTAIVVGATNSGNNNLPFTNTDPSACFSSNGVADGNLDGVEDTCEGGAPTPGLYNPLMCGPGGQAACINGTGTNILVETDAASTLQVQVIPEPATLTLLGLGLAGSAVARRRQLKKRQEQ